MIDADYRGEVKVLLFNFSDVDFIIKEGDRIAQLVLERVSFVSPPFPLALSYCMVERLGSMDCY